jgi:cytochrome c oxidase subunit II
MERYEKIFFGISAVMLTVFLCALAYASIAMHINLPSNQSIIHVKPGQNLAAAVLSTPPFNHPGVRQTGPNEYEVDVIEQAWFFYPNKIKLPVGAQVTFKSTSVDVIHGFYVPGTTINMMVIPGHISVIHYRFEKRGDYLLLCNEYCGKEHQTMYATVEIQ